jgi:integrase/recombinase XerD
MLIGDALNGYWLEKRRDFSKHTVSDYQVTFKRLATYVGADAHIEHINTGVVRAFLNHLVDEYKLSDKTLCNAWTALSSFWSWAEIELNIAHPIRNRIKRPRYRRPQIETYSRTEVQAMLNACELAATWVTKNGKDVHPARPTGQRDKAIIILLVDTGLRASELCQLTLEDYEPETGQITVRHGKGDKQRRVFASEGARKAIWKYLSKRTSPKPTDPLFATHSNQHMDRDALRKMIQGTARRSGVRKANVHRFRHTFAVNFLRNTGNPIELQELLGHERLETIRIYVKLAEMDLQNAQSRASVADNWKLR